MVGVSLATNGVGLEIATVTDNSNGSWIRAGMMMATAKWRKWTMATTTRRRPAEPAQGPEPALYTVLEAAAMLGVGEYVLRAMLKRGELQPVRVGRFVRVRRAELLRLRDGQ